MDRFSSFDGTGIAYIDTGEGAAGPPVVLLHGFAAEHGVNWVAPHVVDALVAAGRRVVASDARGHGASDKPHDPAAYDKSAMVRDVQALLDHLAIDEVDVVGYSMGSIVSCGLVPEEPRVRRLVLGGVGGTLASGFRLTPAVRGAIADALEADDPAAIANESARAFRVFAESTGADRLALAALQRAHEPHDISRISEIAVPTLVIAGDGDTLVGSPADLAATIPDAISKVVSGDHLTAVGDPAFRQAIVEFLT